MIFFRNVAKRSHCTGHRPKNNPKFNEISHQTETLILAPVPFTVSQQVWKQHWINKIYKMYQSSLANSMFANIKIHSMWFEKSLSYFFSVFWHKWFEKSCHERNSYVFTIMRESHRCIQLLEWKTHKLIEKVVNNKNDTLTLKLATVYIDPFHCKLLAYGWIVEWSQVPTPMWWEAQLRFPTMGLLHYHKLGPLALMKLRNNNRTW